MNRRRGSFLSVDKKRAETWGGKYLISTNDEILAEKYAADPDRSRGIVETEQIHFKDHLLNCRVSKSISTATKNCPGVSDGNKLIWGEMSAIPI